VRSAESAAEYQGFQKCTIVSQGTVALMGGRVERLSSSRRPAPPTATRLGQLYSSRSLDIRRGICDSKGYNSPR
jgi:hypothetical protein